MSDFHARHYNFVAKRIRERYPSNLDYVSASEKLVTISGRFILNDLAIDFAKKFAEDNENFDPIRFLDACSPDPDKFPLRELWT